MVRFNLHGSVAVASSSSMSMIRRLIRFSLLLACPIVNSCAGDSVDVDKETHAVHSDSGAGRHHAMVNRLHYETDGTGSVTGISDIFELPNIGAPVKLVGSSLASGVLVSDSIAFVFDRHHGQLYRLRIRDDTSEVARVGRLGRGPGEYSRQISLHRWGVDSVAIWDVVERRLSIYDQNSILVRTTSLPRSIDKASTVLFELLGTGKILLASYSISQEGPIVRRPGSLLIWDEQAKKVSVIDSILGPEYISFRFDGNHLTYSSLNRRFPVVAGSLNGIIYWSESIDSFVNVLHVDTDRRDSIRVMLPTTTLSLEDRQRAAENEVRKVVAVPELAKRELRGLLTPVQKVSAISRFKSSASGNLWLLWDSSHGRSAPIWSIAETGGLRSCALNSRGDVVLDFGVKALLVARYDEGPDVTIVTTRGIPPSCRGASPQ